MTARPAPPPALEAEDERQALRARIAALGPWFHNLDLHGVPTAPDHALGDYPRAKFQGFAHALPADLTGLSVLDIGCNGGFYSLEMKRRGAARVVGIDHDPDYLAQARFAAATLGADITFEPLSVYDVAALAERFDLVLYMGVSYHLRHPLLALDLIHAYVARDLLVFQSLQRGAEPAAAPAPDYAFADETPFETPGWPRLAFVEHAYAGDVTNWWIPNPAASAAMLRAAGFVIEARPEPEVYVCRTGPRPIWGGPVHPRSAPQP